MTNTPYYILIVFYVAFVGTVVLANAIAFLTMKAVQFIWSRRQLPSATSDDVLATQPSTAHGA